MRTNNVKTKTFFAITWALALALAIFGASMATTLTKPNPALASDSGSPKTVRVGYVNFAGYQEGGEGEYKTGFGYEYLQTIAGINNWEYEYVYGSFSELFTKLENGQIDIMGDISYTEERAQKILYTDYPEGTDNFFLYCTADDEQALSDNQKALEGMRIGVTQNSYQQTLLAKWLEENDIEAQVVLYPGSSAINEAMAAKEIQVMAMPKQTISNGYFAVAMIGKADFYFGISKDRPDILEETNEALHTIQDINPYFNASIYSKYANTQASSTLISGEERTWLKEHGYTMRLGYLDESLPYSDKTTDGEMSGLITVLSKSLFSHFGISVVTQAYSDAPSLLKACQQGEVDIIGPIYCDFWMGEQYGMVSSDPISTTTRTLIHKGNDGEDPLAIIGVCNTSIISSEIAAILYPNATIVGFNTYDECVKALRNGSITSILTLSSLANMVRQMTEIEDLFVTDLPNTVDVSLYSKRGNSVPATLATKAITLSSDELVGTALLGNSYVTKEYNAIRFMKENALWVIGLLMVLVIALGAGIFYLVFARKQNARLSKVAYNDALTHVGNRAAYFAKESQLHAQGTSARFMVITADVNGLKGMNDKHGHESGDKLIKNTAVILSRVFGASHVFRIGGDEFVVVLEDELLDKSADLLEKLASLNELYVTPDELDHGKSSFSFGSSTYIPSDKSPSVTLSRADEAMYDHKRKMKVELQRYDQELGLIDFSSLSLSPQTRAAVNSFKVGFGMQPIVSRTEIIGFEAFAKPVGVSVYEMISIMRSKGTLHDMEVITVFGALKTYQDRNLSGLLFLSSFESEMLNDQEGEDLRANFSDCMGQMILELSQYGRHADEATQNKKAFSASEIRTCLSLDRFTKGEFTLDAIQGIKPLYVKLGRRYVEDIHLDAKKQQRFDYLVKALHALGIQAIASHIETAEEFDYLKTTQVDYFQGYYIGKPE